jgi:hypothetical protein
MQVAPSSFAEVLLIGFLASSLLTAAEPTNLSGVKPEFVIGEPPRQKADVPPDPGLYARRWITSLVYSPQGNELAAIHAGGTMSRWDVESKRLKTSVGSELAGSAAYAADGWAIAAFSRRGGYTLWDAVTGNELISQPTPRDNIYGMTSMLFTRDFGRAVRADVYGHVDIVEVATGRALLQFKPYDRRPSLIALSPDGETIATTPLEGRGRAKETKTPLISLWKTSDGSPIAAFGAASDDATFSQFAFSPDGTVIAGLGPQRLELWDVLSHQPIMRLSLEARQFAFSPDGKLLVYVLTDGFGVMELASGQTAWRVVESPAQPGDLKLHKPAGVESLRFSAVAVSPNGEWLATAIAETEPIWVWPLRPPTATVTTQADGIDIESDWAKLEEIDAAAGLSAVWRLGEGGDEIAREIGNRIRPAGGDENNNEEIHRSIAELDDDRFAVRDRAMKALEAHGAAAETLLKSAIEAGASEEARRRIESVLKKLQNRTVRMSGKPLQRIRAIGVLERIGSATAREVLATLATGSLTARETIEAKAALARLEAKRTGP